MKLVIAISGALLLTPIAMSAENVLESSKADKAVSLDAKDAVWSKAKALTINLTETPYKPTGYPGITKTKVTLKSLYDDKNVYFYMQYYDPTKSLVRAPWQKQADGTWKMLGTKDQAGQINDYYEDKAAMFWNINAEGFEKKGCAIACHLTKDGKNNGIEDKSAGRKYTEAGQTIDMWHWKSVRGGVQFDLADDQFVDSNTDPKANGNWGRKNDENNGGDYKANATEDKKMPAFMNPAGKKDLWILDSEKVPFKDEGFKAGDLLAGLTIAKYTGSRADVQTSSNYADGKWTLVFKRALTTDYPKSKEQDVQFSDLKKPYYFGVAVFDNAQINHVYHEGSIKLTFK